MRSAAGRVKLVAVLLLLVLAQFAARPRLGDPRFTPDFLFVALLFFAIRSRPAAGAVAGFVVGLVIDALAPTAFGAGAFALTVVGYLAGWLKAVFFADNLLVNALFVLVASWTRDVLQVLAGNQLKGGALAWQLLAISPLAAMGTAIAAVGALLLFRGWLRTGAAA